MLVSFITQILILVILIHAIMEGSVFLQMKESGLLAHVRRTVLVNIAKTARQVNLKFMRINYYQ